jgi:hypothetical protein
MPDLNCQDCGDMEPDHARRRRCKACGFLVCAWCFHHVHVLHSLLAATKAVAK